MSHHDPLIWATARAGEPITAYPASAVKALLDGDHATFLKAKGVLVDPETGVPLSDAEAARYRNLVNASASAIDADSVYARWNKVKRERSAEEAARARRERKPDPDLVSATAIDAAAIYAKWNAPKRTRLARRSR